MTESTGSTPIIELRDISKYFGEFQALRDVSLQVDLGEKVVVCGPSGSGKSTMIRCINRLETHDEGTIVVDGIELSEDMRNILAVRREVGMVFQQFNLFPHLTVLENCSLAPIWVRKMRKVDAGSDIAWRIPLAGGQDPSRDVTLRAGFLFFRHRGIP